MKSIQYVATPVLLLLLVTLPVQADLSQYLDSAREALDSSGVAVPATDLTNDELVAGLKQALDKGTQFAVNKLGQPGGFLDNKKVRIPMPDSLSWVESSLRTVGQDEMADEFIDTMNTAAEQAVPEAADIFAGAIKEMSVQDAQGILSGADNAATEYFRSNTEAELTQRMRPIVETATASTGVTSAYKDMLGAAGGFAGMMPATATDIDGYITSKTLDGLFLMIAREERKIRKNPAARSTELLQKVFSAY